jgi:hypothetical protein
MLGKSATSVTLLIVNELVGNKMATREQQTGNILAGRTLV